ncbi:hypothetical protein U1Q18_007498, partial [Sarracenia purpurea var. burkii]
ALTKAKEGRSPMNNEELGTVIDWLAFRRGFDPVEITDWFYSPSASRSMDETKGVSPAPSGAYNLNEQGFFMSYVTHDLDEEGMLAPLDRRVEEKKSKGGAASSQRQASKLGSEPVGLDKDEEVVKEEKGAKEVGTSPIANDTKKGMTSKPSSVSRDCQGINEISEDGADKNPVQFSDVICHEELKLSIEGKSNEEEADCGGEEGGSESDYEGSESEDDGEDVPDEGANDLPEEKGEILDEIGTKVNFSDVACGMVESRSYCGSEGKQLGDSCSDTSLALQVLDKVSDRKSIKDLVNLDNVAVCPLGLAGVSDLEKQIGHELGILRHPLHVFEN